MLNFSLPFAGGGGIGIGTGGLPPLSLSSSARSEWGQNGAAWSASGAGDWSVNLGGSGGGVQSAMGGINPLWILAGVAAWYFLRK